MSVSIVIAYHNEGKRFLLQTIDSLESTIDVQDYEIIVVDDHSDEEVEIDGVRVIRHPENKGVGCAFDTGVQAARFEDIFLMGCDLRFIDNNWASLMLREIGKHPESFICSAVVPLSHEYPEIDFHVAKKYNKLDSHKGATIKLYMGTDYHHILEASWMPREFLPLRRPDYKEPTECYEVACILGAFYGVKKKWYLYCDGFWGHRFWGTLEPLISLKSYLFGGSCLVAPFVEVAHLFKQPNSGGHGTVSRYGVYKAHNRIMTASLLFPSIIRVKLMRWMQDDDYKREGLRLYRERIDDVISKRDEYKNKTVFQMKDIINKFNLQ